MTLKNLIKSILLAIIILAVMAVAFNRISDKVSKNRSRWGAELEKKTICISSERLSGGD